MNGRNQLTRHGLRLALACLVAAALPSAATAGRRDKIVLRTGLEQKIEIPSFPMEMLHAPLVDAQDQTVGALDAVITITLLPPMDDPDGPVSGIVQGVATLPQGQVIFTGTLEDGDGPFKLAITGGTRAYRDAGGYIRVTPTEEDQGSRLAFYLTTSR